MEKRNLLFVAVIVLMILSGCAADIVEPNVGEGVDRSPYWRLQDWENLKLTWATLMVSETTASFNVQMRGSVLVRNLAYHKQVVIRYTTDNWNTYTDVNAWYSQTSNFNPYGDSNYSAEFWNFEGETLTFTKAHSGQSLAGAMPNDIQFAIRYTVNGQTFWDNNNGQNYILNANVRYISN